MIKKIALFLIMTFAHSFPLFSDGFFSVHSPNGVDVWAVGNGGVVFHSFDGGVTWTTFTQGATTLRYVYTNGSMVWMVGDGGAFHQSTNGGTSWSTQTLAGGVILRSVWFIDAQTGWIAGNGGTILKTTDGGTLWSSQTSGTSQHLYALSFVDAQTGYAAGAAGTLRKTTDGGSTWTSISSGGWSKDILSVSASGSTVYVSGVDEFCYKSTNGGTSWTELNFKTDTHSDVDAVFAISPTSACFIGGGGFIRTTTDGGATYNFGTHQMHAKLNAVYFYNTTKGWACSEKNNAILRTTDGGATWQLPQGTTVNYAWQQKTGNLSSIGNTFMVNPWNKNIIYVVMGSTVYASYNRGDSWTSIATITGGGSTWSFYVSPKDTNKWIAATSGTGGEGVRRTTNHGATWTTTLLRNFTSYGMPLEMDPDHPDTVIFAADGTSGPNGILYISTNFGATWDTLWQRDGSAYTSFRSPCDVVVVPGNTNLWYVGDGVTGSGNAQMWRSDDYGQSWTSIYSVSGSEIPMISISRLRNTAAYATAWGSGGFWKTTNSGSDWSQIATTGSTWGTDVAKDDPNVVIYGTYGGGTSFLSTNAGGSFNNVALSGSNSGMLAYDRATFLAHQAGGGVWKYNFTYTVPTTNAQVITLITPSGGENWAYNSVHNITWSAGNITNVRIEYKTSPAGSWQIIAASVQASLGTYAWTIPNTPTTQARVRISDASDASPVDSSGLFSITVAEISSTPQSLAFGDVSVGLIGWDTLRLSNTGTGTLVVSSVVTGTSFFTAGRTSFTIPPGSSDTLSVVFAPGDVQDYSDTLTISSNALGSPTKIPLSGTGIQLFHFLSKLILQDNGGEKDSLEFGTGQGATDGVDKVFGEYELPPLPPLGVFDVRWQITGTEGSRRDVRDTLGGSRQQVTYTGKLQAGEGGYPFHLRWNPLALPSEGSFMLRYTDGNPIAVNMRQQDSAMVNEAETFQIVYSLGTTVSSTAQQGWNIVSVPVTVADRRKTEVFPTSISNAFAYTPSGYVNRDTLEYGLGYWLKFASTQSVLVTGDARNEDTIDVIQGWNIIGSISDPVAVGSIIQIPSGIVISPYFGYGSTGYTPATMIEPMKGYWVKVNQSGQLVLTAVAVSTISRRGNGVAK
jgi:photosystem II stability/assembly factor-like uncharacterized protein